VEKEVTQYVQNQCGEMAVAGSFPFASSLVPLLPCDRGMIKSLTIHTQYARGL
jgi:hypothetical protein